MRNGNETSRRLGNSNADGSVSHAEKHGVIGPRPSFQDSLRNFFTLKLVFGLVAVAIFAAAITYILMHTSR